LGREFPPPERCHVSWLCLYHALILLQNAHGFRKLDFVCDFFTILIRVRLIREALLGSGRVCLYLLDICKLPNDVFIFTWPMQNWPGF